MRTADEILAAQDALLAGAEGRDLTDDEVTRYEGLERELESRRSQDALRDRHAAARAAVTPAIHTATNNPPDDTLDRAFEHYMRTGQENADLQQLRAQSEGIGTAGGFLVPDGFRNKLVDRMVAFGGLANVVENITTSTGNPLPWVTIDDTANVGEIVAEGGTFSSGADLVFGEANLGAYKYAAGGASSLPLRVSWELLQDSAFDVQGLVARKLGQRIARIQAQHVVRGTGVGQPQGIVTDRTPVETAGTTEITYADLLEWVHSVDPAYRENGRWAFNDATLQVIRGILDTNDRPIVKRADDSAATGAGGETLLGYPVTIDQAFVDYDADDATDLFGVFGDLNEGYVVRRVRDVVLVVNPYSRASNFQTEFSAYARMDAVQQNTNAYIVMSGNTP